MHGATKANRGWGFCFQDVSVRVFAGSWDYGFRVWEFGFGGVLGLGVRSVEFWGILCEGFISFAFRVLGSGGYIHFWPRDFGDVGVGIAG